jgi:tetratricopeptide (TPR) repeat protein
MKTGGWVRGFSFALAALLSVFAEPWSQVPLSAGQRPPTPPSFDSLDQWLSAVEHHVPGQRDEALRTATSWNANELYEILFHAGPLVALASDPDAIINFRRLPGSDKPTAVYSEGDLKRLQELSRRASSWGKRALLTRGALLHTDAALLGDGAPGGDTHRPSIRSVEVFVQESDGRQLGSHEIAGHLKAARTLLGMLSTNPQADATVRLWYRATVAYLQREVRLDQVQVDAALALFPKDPEILLLAGALHETFASARIQQLVASADLPFGVSLGIKSTHDELRLAERLFRRAVSADGQHTEARLHLGNVLGQLGRHKEAAGMLRQALRHVGADPVLAYYARMFAGREAEQLGNVEEARASYEQASQLFPRAQSSLVALSGLAQRRGDDTAAHRTLERALAATKTTNDGDDPWWRYPSYTGRSADALLITARTALADEVHR